MRSVVDRNVVMRRIPVLNLFQERLCTMQLVGWLVGSLVRSTVVNVVTTVILNSNPKNVLYIGTQFVV